MIYIIIIVLLLAIILAVVHYASTIQVTNEILKQGGLITILSPLDTALQTFGFVLYKDETNIIEYRRYEDSNCYISVRVWKNVNMQFPYEMKFEKYDNLTKVDANTPSYIGPTITYERYIAIIANELQRINISSNHDIRKESPEVSADIAKSESIPVSDRCELQYLSRPVINLKSRQLFNLGFYVINSHGLLEIPREEVLRNDFDFKAEYFPDFRALNWDSYMTASKLFESAFEADNNNVLAKIFVQVALLHADFHNEYSDLDRSEIVEKLKALTLEYPRNGIVWIEYAFAKSTMGYDSPEEVETAINIALQICDDSSYLYFNASQIYKDFFCDDTKAEQMLKSAINCQYNIAEFHYIQSLANKDCYHTLFHIEQAIKIRPVMDYFFTRDSCINEMEFKEISTPNIDPEKVKEEYNSKCAEVKGRVDYYNRKRNFTKFRDLELDHIEVGEEGVRFKYLDHEEFKAPTSIIFLDLNCSLEQLKDLNLVQCPFYINSGTINEENEELFLKRLNIKNLLAES